MEASYQEQLQIREQSAQSNINYMKRRLKEITTDSDIGIRDPNKN